MLTLFLIKIKWLEFNVLRNGSKKRFLLVKIDIVFLPTKFIVYWILVHGGVGSLEITKQSDPISEQVHGGVGSLEMAITLLLAR